MKIPLDKRSALPRSFLMIDFFCFFFAVSAAYVLRLRNRVAKLEAIAYRDPLTGLYTRRVFEERLAQARAHSLRHPAEPFSVLALDLDNFKRRNDTYGHAHGDKCLRILAKALTEGARHGDTVARIGGEEFAILMPSTVHETAQLVGQRILAQLYAMPCESGPLTFSAGVADELPSADQALYAAKRSGKARVTIFEEVAA